MDFPRTVDEITPEWLTQVLRESGAIDGATVESFSASGLDGGVVGDVNRLELLYSTESDVGPKSIIAKLAISDDEKREVINAGGLYEREVNFYNLLNTQSGLPVPAVYRADHESDTGYFVLLLEDLQRFRAVDQRDDCSLEDGSTAVHSLARMHSKWWGSERLYEFDWLTDFTDPSLLDRMSDRYNESLDRFLEIGQGLLPADYEPVARNYGKSLRGVIGHFSRSPVTLVHGDFRLGNLLFNDELGAEDPIYVFDWQLASRGKAAVDVAYFLGWSFSTDSRRRYEKQLLSEYHESLIDYGVSGYSFEEFNTDVRIGAFRLMHIATTAIVQLGQHLLETEEGIQLLRGLCSRLQTLLDWNCDEVIPR